MAFTGAAWRDTCLEARTIVDDRVTRKAVPPGEQAKLCVRHRRQRLVSGEIDAGDAEVDEDGRRLEVEGALGVCIRVMPPAHEERPAPCSCHKCRLFAFFLPLLENGPRASIYLQDNMSRTARVALKACRLSRNVPCGNAEALPSAMETMEG